MTDKRKREVEQMIADAKRASDLDWARELERELEAHRSKTRK